MIRRIHVVALGLLLGLAATGCAQEREPIDRVQPNVLKKSFFLGEDIHDSADDPEFLTRAYSVGSPYSQNTFYYGTGSGLDRVRFEVTEDLLIARKSYQVGRGRDDKGIPGGEANGTVVAAYRIDSHFDIRKSYNPVTGEETNVTEENGSDRPWYEREYFRVDWSTNEVANPMYLDEMFSAWFGDPKITPMRYYVTDPNSEDAPLLDEKDGYLEVTNRYFVEPGNMYFSWGTLPSCVVYGIITGTANEDCNMQQADIRLGFWKVKPDHDFEPFILTHAYNDVTHGFANDNSSLYTEWGSPIQDYDPQYGFTDEGYQIPQNAVNIWQKSHVDIACNDKFDGDNNGTADQCEAYVGSKGSRCDVFMGKCTIPYRDRVVKTTGWFVNKEMPLLYQDTVDEAGNPLDRGAAEDVVYSWNQLFTASVAFARAAECRRTGDGDKATCDAQFFAPEKQMVSYGGWLVDVALDQKPVFTLCHNPVRNYDIEEACGKPGYEARLGDLRKFFLVDLPDASTVPFGGVSNLTPEPTTGELIGSTSLTVYTKMRARYILDTLLVAMGDMTLEEFMGGAASERYAKTMSGPTRSKPLSQEEMQKRIDSINGFNLAQSNMVPGAPITDNRIEMVKAAIRAKTELKDDQAMRAMQAIKNDQMLEPLRGTTFETQLTDPYFLKAAHIDPSTSLTEDVLDTASPLRMDAAKLQLLQSDMEKRFANAGACYSELNAQSVGAVVNAPLANYFMQKYGHLTKAERFEAMRKDLTIESFKGVMLHEMGHSIGMRHQFTSSWDSMNYMPQYWQLRTAEGTATAGCAGKPRDTSVADNCMGPRYIDPLTDEEQGYGPEPRPGLEYFANTSTMEYQAERFSETAGLGNWDYAETKAIYARVLETYDPNTMPRDGGEVLDQRRLATRMFTQLADVDYVWDRIVFDDGSTPFGPDEYGMHSWHYTKVARGMNVFDPNRDCRDATPEEKAKAEWRIVHGKICQPYPKDYAAFDDFVSDYNAEAEEPMTLWHTRPDLQGGNADMVRWSYRIGEHYYDSYVHTNMLDSGADVYEATVNEIKHFNANYPIYYFRRQGRGTPPSWRAAGSAMRFFERIRSYHWSIANDNLRWLGFGQDYFDIFTSDDNWSRPGLMANAEVFNALATYVLIPQPGDYRLREGDPSGVYDAIDGEDPNADFVVQTIDGRFVDDAYNYGPDAGGSWGYSDYETRAGFSVEKAYAFLALCDSRPTLSTIARETYLDDRYVKLNFRSDLPEAFDRLFGGLLAEDWQALGMWVPGDTPQGAPVSPAMLDLMEVRNAPSRPAGAKVLFPNVGYTQQLYAAIFSALYARENTDMTLIHKMRIWIDGVEANISDVAFPGAENQIRFYDPASGFTYIARRFGTEEIDGREVERGIASRMMQRANQLVTLSYQVERDAQENPVLDEYGRPVLILDAQGQPQPLDTFDSKMGELVRYVGLVDGVRQLGHILGQGPY
jgi:hypothetical protein